MRNALIALLVLGCTAAQAAELKIGVIDPLAAIAGTDQYKKAAADLDKELATDKARVTRLQGDLNACRQKMQTDGATMSATEQAKLKSDCEAKFNEYQALGQKVTKIVNEREQAILKDLGPKLQKAVEAVAREGAFDLIVQKEALMFAKPEFDVSAKVTAKVNAAK